MLKIGDEKQCIKREMQLQNLSKRTRGLLPLWAGYRLAFYLCRFIQFGKTKIFNKIS